MRLDLRVLEAELKAPLRPSGPAPVLRPLVFVRIRDADGSAGYGEAAPLEPYDGVSIERTLQALSAHEQVLLHTEGLAHAEILGYCAAADPLPQALAAVDLALWDLAGRRGGVSVSSLLGGGAPGPIEVNATIGAVEPTAAAAEARVARDAGFTTVKVKVGTPDDRQRLGAIREAVGPALKIRVDANGAWTQLDAPERIRALSRFDVELFEEPVHGNEAIAAVTEALPGFALALDESADAGSGTFTRRHCTAVCLKVASSGGITGLLSDAAAARTVGYEVYVASTLDGPLGIAAALHAATVVAPDRPCGLTTLERFAAPIADVLRPDNGTMSAPAGPGLGDGLIGWYDSQ
jgi:L-alanine-DL-glutamate epimerase-like enolase superfamily enzyme